MTPDGSLAADLLPEGLDHDALVTTLTSFFPRGEWSSGNTVTYRTQDGEVGLTLIYGRRGRLADVQRGPGLTDELLAELRERVDLLTSNSETVIWRDVFFTMPSVEGFWRYRDDWQIVPAPPQAPRPDVLLGDFPFIIEIRLPWYPEQPMLSGVTQNRRAWELQLILNLVLRHRVKRFGPRVGDHSWMLLHDDGTFSARFLQPGYTIPDWTYQTPDFTPTEGIPPVPEVSDDDYRAQRGIDLDAVFEIPDVLRPLLDRYHAVAPEVRDRFLRACYWYERSGAAWSMSASLGHVAAVTAIETLVEQVPAEPCPTCGRDTSPGPTRGYRDFVERYAPRISKEDRDMVYKLRSNLVHTGHPLDIDVPGPWAALVPREIEGQQTYASAREAARDAIVNWLLDQP